MLINVRSYGFVISAVLVFATLCILIGFSSIGNRLSKLEKAQADCESRILWLEDNWPQSTQQLSALVEILTGGDVEEIIKRVAVGLADEVADEVADELGKEIRRKRVCNHDEY